MKSKQSLPLRDKQVVLGLNGWPERGHDASACFVIDNKIVAFAEEERFTRKRYSFDSMPVLSTAYCLEEAKVQLEDITKIVFGWNMPRVYKMHGRKFPYKEEVLAELIFPKSLYNYKKFPKIEFLNHHIAHAASAYRVSGFDKASILILDGQGEDASGTLAVGENGIIKIISTIPIVYSLGYMMEAACKFIGLRTSDAGKLMGLAGHGKMGKMFDNILLDESGYSIKDFPLDKKLLSESLDEQQEVIKLWINYFNSKFDFKINKKVRFDLMKGNIISELEFKREQKEFASSVQNTLESVIIHLTKILIRKTGIKNLVIAGGIGLNCTTNGKIVSEKIVDRLYVQPACNDAGVSIGAALESSWRLSKSEFKCHRLDEIYLGPEYNNIEIEKILKELKVPYKNSKNIEKLAAKALYKGKIVGWFQGRMEGGPRALGNRSILANPKIKSMHDTVNKIKSRENWRPLAPSILEENREDYFEDSSYSPFMLQNHLVKKEKIRLIPAVTHIDGSSRFQSVTKGLNPLYYSLIEEFYKLSKIPLIMNTSFNIGGEPIVCTPEQAIKTFYSSAIDCLAIGDYWITKNEK